MRVDRSAVSGKICSSFLQFGKALSRLFSTPSSICTYVWVCSSSVRLGVFTVCQTCTPRPCIWMTWARRVWMAARISFWCSRDVMPRLNTSLWTQRSKDLPRLVPKKKEKFTGLCVLSWGDQLHDHREKYVYKVTLPVLELSFKS